MYDENVSHTLVTIQLLIFQYYLWCPIIRSEGFITYVTPPPPIKSFPRPQSKEALPKIIIFVCKIFVTKNRIHWYKYNRNHFNAAAFHMATLFYNFVTWQCVWMPLLGQLQLLLQSIKAVYISNISLLKLTTHLHNPPHPQQYYLLKPYPLMSWPLVVLEGFSAGVCTRESPGLNVSLRPARRGTLDAVWMTLFFGVDDVADELSFFGMVALAGVDELICRPQRKQKLGITESYLIFVNKYCTYSDDSFIWAPIVWKSWKSRQKVWKPISTSQLMGDSVIRKTR